MAETRSTWIELIGGVGVEIADVYDQAADEYAPGLQNVVRLESEGADAQVTYTGKTGAGRLSRRDDGSTIAEKKRYKTYNTTVAFNNYDGYIDVTSNTIEDKDAEWRAKLDEVKDLAIAARASQDESAMQLFNGGFATTADVNTWRMTWYGE